MPLAREQPSPGSDTKKSPSKKISNESEGVGYALLHFHLLNSTVQSKAAAEGGKTFPFSDEDSHPKRSL
jgi:hypothetical protein